MHVWLGMYHKSYYCIQFDTNLGKDKNPSVSSYPSYGLNIRENWNLLLSLATSVGEGQHLIQSWVCRLANLSCKNLLATKKLSSNTKCGETVALYFTEESNNIWTSACCLERNGYRHKRVFSIHSKNRKSNFKHFSKM